MDKETKGLAWSMRCAFFRAWCSCLVLQLLDLIFPFLNPHHTDSVKEKMQMDKRRYSTNLGFLGPLHWGSHLMQRCRTSSIIPSTIRCTFCLDHWRSYHVPILILHLDRCGPQQREFGQCNPCLFMCSGCFSLLLSSNLRVNNSNSLKRKFKWSIFFFSWVPWHHQQRWRE